MDKFASWMRHGVFFYEWVIFSVCKRRVAQGFALPDFCSFV